MSLSKTVAGNVLTEEGWVKGELHFEGRVIDINGVSVDPSENSDDYILPGFIDLHVHGGGGRDIMDAGDAVYTVSRMHARHGTTSMLATTMTSPISDLEAALAAKARPACWACTSKAPISIRASSVRSPIMHRRRTWLKSNACRRLRR
jgi:N-acetylglucosamine-6-phosphate deacetylase